MTARQIRRAAERKARKETGREQNVSPVNPSTGPRTEEGKATSSLNALKTGLTGRTILLPSDDIALYERHLAHYRQLWQPVGEHECILVQAIADTWWRLGRIPLLEAALYAKGRTELANCDPKLKELETYLGYEKQFRNLALQERRLANYANRLKAELEEMQAKRQPQPKAMHQPQPEAECPAESLAEESPAAVAPLNHEDSALQFEFSTGDFDETAGLSAHHISATPAGPDLNLEM